MSVLNPIIRLNFNPGSDPKNFILERLNVNKENWAILTTEFEKQFKQWVGAEHIVRNLYRNKHYQRIPSTKQHKKLLG